MRYCPGGTVTFAASLFFVLTLLIPGMADIKNPEKIASVEGITEYRLANGLRVLLFQDNSQPKVTVNSTIFVGSRHEGYGEAGMAHLLEHMLFKGTALNPDIPKALKDRGANFNGTTWLDRTNYYETLPSSNENLEFAIRLEADRLVNSNMRGEDLISEFSVVRSEFELGENSPQEVLQQRMFSAAFQWHNYGKSTIGNRSDIELVSIESLRNFYRKYYRVDNAMLIVAGDFDSEKALEFTNKYFGILEPPKGSIPKTYTIEPPQDGDRTTSVRRVGDSQFVGAVYHVPAGPHPEFPAIEVLSVVLTDDPSGRLYQAMIETKLATEVQGGAYALHDPGVLTFTAQVPKEKSIGDAKNALIGTLEGLAEKPITEAEVERARRQLLNQRETAASKSHVVAIELSDWAAQGDWRLYFLFRDGLEQVTAADVQLVAQKYLVQNNRTVGLFEPLESSQRVVIAERPKIEDLVKDYTGREAVNQGEQFDPSPRNIESRVVRGELKSGIPYAMLAKKTRGSTVNVALTLRFGDEKSLMGKSAAIDMLGDLMMRGTKSMSLQQLNDRLDELNATVNVASRNQELRVNIESKRDRLLQVLEVIEDVLKNPAFDEHEFELLRDQFIAQLEEQKQEPQALAPIAVAQTLSPYKRGDIRHVSTVDEELEDFKALKLSDVKNLHSRYLSGNEGEVAVVGDFDPQEVEPKLSAMLANWKSKIPYQRVASAATTDLKVPMKSIETPDKANSVYFAGQHYAMRDDHPKYPALLMGNYILGGGGLSSRLIDRIRQKDGLSYSVGSSIRANPIDEQTVFSVHAIANPANRDKLIKAIDEELRKIVKEGVTEKELKDSVQGYLQSQQLTRSRDATLAAILANNLFTGRTMKYYETLESKISGLTVETVNEAISEYVSPDHLVIATAGEFAVPTPVKPKDQTEKKNGK